MESTVSGTDNQESRHVNQSSAPSQAKLDVNLLRTSPQPIIYTTAQLHESLNGIYFRIITEKDSDWK